MEILNWGNLVLCGIVLFFCSIFLGLFRVSLTKQYGKGLVLVIRTCLFFLIALYLGFLRGYTISLFSFLVLSNELGGLLCMVSGDGASSGPNQGWTDLLLGSEEMESTAQQPPVVPSGGSPAGVWTRFEEDVLLESSSGRSDSNPSVNQPQPGEQAMPPASPVASGEAEPAPAPALPHPIIIPELEHPLLSDEVRSDVLYSRYGILNFGGDDGLSRLGSIISNQVIVERRVEAALVADGFHPLSILDRYRDIRHYLHSPQGELMTPRTYQSYVNQIMEHGTRQSLPYQRVIRAIHHSHILLDRVDGRLF